MATPTLLPPGTESYDPRFESLILFNAELELLADGFRWLEGPVWFGDHRCLLFNDLPNNRTLRWSEIHGVSVFRESSDYGNGQTRDRQGRLITCHHRSRNLTRLEHDGSSTTLVNQADGKRLNAPNDVVVKSDGSVWFSDPLYGLINDYEGGRQVSDQPAALYRLDPASGDLNRMASDFDGPNGLAFPRMSASSMWPNLEHQVRWSPGNTSACLMSVRMAAPSPAERFSTKSRRAGPMASGWMSMEISGAAPAMVCTASPPMAPCWAKCSYRSACPIFVSAIASTAVCLSAPPHPSTRCLPTPAALSAPKTAP